MLSKDKPVRITTDWKLNLKTTEAESQVKKATNQGLKDSVVDISNDAIRLSPVLTSNNRRSIMFEVGPGGEVAKGELEGAVYSTSGYGGILETGSKFMGARPYFYPALVKNLPNLPKNIKAHLT